MDGGLVLSLILTQWRPSYLLFRWRNKLQFQLSVRPGQREGGKDGPSGMKSQLVLPTLLCTGIADIRSIQLQLASIVVTNSMELFCNQYPGCLLQSHCTACLSLLLFLMAETHRTNDSYKTHFSSVSLNTSCQKSSLAK